MRETGSGGGRGDGGEGKRVSCAHEGRRSVGTGGRGEGGRKWMRMLTEKERHLPVGYLDCTMSSVV